jgi:UDP-N-acetylmuramoyl-L-alanyl-D-glutamate--2,6-diaminopimelate ligase
MTPLSLGGRRSDSRRPAVLLRRAAIAAGADGLLVEMHPNPDKAMSDGGQSLFPEQFARLVREARAIAEGRLICVFGAGGDRDRGKRPLMGAAVRRLADVAIVTSDNPRSEDPGAIVEEILSGIADRSDTEAIVDRRAAIERAVELAAPGDVLVIAGKGHEQGQEFEDGRKLPFDDATVAREALRARLVA